MLCRYLLGLNIPGGSHSSGRARKAIQSIGSDLKGLKALESFPVSCTYGVGWLFVMATALAPVEILPPSALNFQGQPNSNSDTSSLCGRNSPTHPTPVSP